MTIIERCKLADKRRNAILQLADIIRLNEQYPDDLELEQELIPLMNARLETIVKCHNELTQEIGHLVRSPFLLYFERRKRL